MNCSLCKKECVDIIRSEIQPSDMYDDATLRIVSCPDGHEKHLILVQSERRGTLDDETIDIQESPLNETRAAELITLANECPDRSDRNCDCAWHMKSTVNKLNI